MFSLYVDMGNRFFYMLAISVEQRVFCRICILEGEDVPPRVCNDENVVESSVKCCAWLPYRFEAKSSSHFYGRSVLESVIT